VWLFDANPEVGDSEVIFAGLCCFHLTSSAHQFYTPTHIQSPPKPQPSATDQYYFASRYIFFKIENEEDSTQIGVQLKLVNLSTAPLLFALFDLGDNCTYSYIVDHTKILQLTPPQQTSSDPLIPPFFRFTFAHIAVLFYHTPSTVNSFQLLARCVEHMLCVLKPVINMDDRKCVSYLQSPVHANKHAVAVCTLQDYYLQWSGLVKIIEEFSYCNSNVANDENFGTLESMVLHKYPLDTHAISECTNAHLLQLSTQTKNMVIAHTNKAIHSPRDTTHSNADSAHQILAKRHEFCSLWETNIISKLLLRKGV